LTSVDTFQIILNSLLVTDPASIYSLALSTHSFDIVTRLGKAKDIFGIMAKAAPAKIGFGPLQQSYRLSLLPFKQPTCPGRKVKTPPGVKHTVAFEGSIGRVRVRSSDGTSWSLKFSDYDGSADATMKAAKEWIEKNS
jgi:hypothetical protein